MGLRSLYLGVHKFDVGFYMFYMCIIWFTHGLHVSVSFADVSIAFM